MSVTVAGLEGSGLTMTSGSGLVVGLLISLASRMRRAAASIASTARSTALFAAVRPDGRVTTTRIRQPRAVSSAIPRTLTAIGLDPLRSPDRQGEDRAILNRTLGQRNQAIRDGSGRDDR